MNRREVGKCETLSIVYASSRLDVVRAQNCEATPFSADCCGAPMTDTFLIGASGWAGF